MRYPYDDMLERQRAALEDGPEISFTAATQRTANREHKCYECGGTIAPGQRYTREVAKVDGQMFTQKHHFPSSCDHGPEY